jgi:hypothetical protein
VIDLKVKHNELESYLENKFEKLMQRKKQKLEILIIKIVERYLRNAITITVMKQVHFNSNAST